MRYNIVAHHYYFQDSNGHLQFVYYGIFVFSPFDALLRVFKLEPENPTKDLQEARRYLEGMTQAFPTVLDRSLDACMQLTATPANERYRLVLDGQITGSVSNVRHWRDLKDECLKDLSTNVVTGEVRLYIAGVYGTRLSNASVRDRAMFVEETFQEWESRQRTEDRGD